MAILQVIKVVLILFPQQYSRAFDPVYILPQTDYPILVTNLRIY